MLWFVKKAFVFAYLTTVHKFYGLKASQMSKVCATILDKMDEKLRPPRPPISRMEKMARFRCSVNTSLNWGEGCFYFSFYSVQDCSSQEYPDAEEIKNLCEQNFRGHSTKRLQ